MEQRGNVSVHVPGALSVYEILRFVGYLINSIYRLVQHLCPSLNTIGSNEINISLFSKYYRFKRKQHLTILSRARLIISHHLQLFYV
jgi:hypothetical protein